MSKAETTEQRRQRLLNDLVAIVNGVRWGMPGYNTSIVEKSAGFPAGGSSGGSKGAVSRPVETRLGLNADVKNPEWGMDDPAATWQGDFDKRLEKAWRAAEELWQEYKRVGHPKRGAGPMKDPGCELCAKVPEHWCPTYATTEVVTVGKKGAPDNVRRVPLCVWCYEFQRPDRAGRLPAEVEVVAHSEGRRVRWKVGA